MTRYEELKNKALEMIKEDDDLFVDMVNELAGWNGFADGFRAFPMDELDELFCGVSLTEFLRMIDKDDFDLNDEYFIDTIWGLQSTDDIAGHYRNNVDEEELIDEIIDHAGNLYFSDSDFEELIDEIIEEKYNDDEE